jgi:toxin-antitoxin system PIN domain toxin
MLVDANILLYAVDESSHAHEPAVRWLTDQLNGPRRIGLPWQSLVAFLRISTHPRASAAPLQPDDALRYVEEWLGADVAWVPVPGPRHWEILGDLIGRHQVRADLVGDAHLAALALEHGLTLCSADSDFARFPKLSWTNPLT